APPAPLAARAGAVLIVGAAAGALAILAVSLYQRIRRPAALAHPARAALHAALAERASGATVVELAAAAGLERKTAEYHLLYLARLGIVRSEVPPEGGRRFSLHAQAQPPGLHERILSAVATSPGATTREIAKLLGVSRARADRRGKDLVLGGHRESRLHA